MTRAEYNYYYSEFPNDSYRFLSESEFDPSVSLYWPGSATINTGMNYSPVFIDLLDKINQCEYDYDASNDYTIVKIKYKRTSQPDDNITGYNLDDIMNMIQIHKVKSFEDIYNCVIAYPKNNNRTDVDKMFKVYLQYNNPPKYE